MKQPTLNEALEVLNKHGGFFKGKGDGSVKRETDDNFSDIIERRLENGE